MSLELGGFAEAENAGSGPRKHAVARVGTTFAQIQLVQIQQASEIPFDITRIRFSCGFEATWSRIYLDSMPFGFDLFGFDVAWIRISLPSKPPGFDFC